MLERDLDKEYIQCYIINCDIEINLIRFGSEGLVTK